MPGGCGGSAKAFAEITPDTHLERLSSLSASVALNIKKLSNPFKIVADILQKDPQNLGLFSSHCARACVCVCAHAHKPTYNTLLYYSQNQGCIMSWFFFLVPVEHTSYFSTKEENLSEKHFYFNLSCSPSVFIFYFTFQGQTCRVKEQRDKQKIFSSRMNSSRTRVVVEF